MRRALQVPTGSVTLAGFDPDATPLATTNKSGKLKLPVDDSRLAGLQERLFAEATAGGRRSVLLVLQGMDTSGKGGITNHVVGIFEPIGVQYTAFKKPTEEELAHDFLWRIRRRLPEPGIIGVFDRSHYEDVLVPRVHELISLDALNERYDEINRFEAEVVATGTTIVKCFLHISPGAQEKRLRQRLKDPTKRWKYNPADLETRRKWSAYQDAYAEALRRCDTEVAPWYVIPSDRKWYRNWAVARVLLETLADLDPHYPSLGFNPKVELSALKVAAAPR